MDECTDISEYYQIPLSDLIVPAYYAKLIKRLMAISGFSNLRGEKVFIETIGDIAVLEPYQFSNCVGIGKKYTELLINFKKELPFFLKATGQSQKLSFADIIFTSLDNPFNPTTPIFELGLSPKYQKLINKILAVMDNIKTVQDIIDIDIISFSQLPSVGKLYVESLVNLQNTLSPLPMTEINIANNHIVSKKPLPSQSILSKLYINHVFLSPSQIRKLKKLDRFYGDKIDIRNVNTLLNLDRIDLGKQAGFGLVFLNTLTELQNDIKNELSTLPEDITAHTIRKRGMFISSEIIFMPFYEIDNILIEDIECYLWTLDEMRMNIALSRWGFNQPYETLEELGNHYSLTRARIGQFEKTINANLLLSFRIQPKVLWANIREKMTEDLKVLLPNLAKCFATDKLFYSFVELFCKVENGSISEIIFPKIKNYILNPIFCKTPSPVSEDTIINELMSNYGHSKASAIHGLKALDRQNKIRVTEQGIYPKDLGRTEAIAHVLSFYPQGLPWKDIARIINKNGYSSTLFDETRIGNGFHNSEHVYLCAHGTYRNLMFLDLEQFDISAIMQDLLNYFKERQLTALHLHDYYYQTKDKSYEIEYFTLRHIVREYGEEYGLYFNGKSGTDSVSLDPSVILISQADVIIRVLNASKVAMTMQEIAERLRSKSTAHASFYINNLMEEGKIVRVDKMVYTTAEKAFVCLDIAAIMMVIQEIMNVPDIIVEADVFREYVNLELNLSYSKYIYAALVKTKIKELDWYCGHMLFSKYPIPYKNLLDMCKKLCNVELSNSQNAKIIQKAVWLTDAVTSAAIQQWRWKLTH